MPILRASDALPAIVEDSDEDDELPRAEPSSIGRKRKVEQSEDEEEGAAEA